MKHRLKLVRHGIRTIWTYQLKCEFCGMRVVYGKWGIRDIVTNGGVWRPELFADRPLGMCASRPVGRIESIVEDDAGISALIEISPEYANQLGVWASARGR